MQVQLESFATFGALPADARALFAASDNVFTSPAWWRTVVAHAMPPRMQAIFLLCRIDEAPAALFPLCQARSRLALSSLTSPYTCLYTPLLRADLQATELAEVFVAFGSFCRDLATTRLDCLPADWPALAACEAGARGAGLKVVRFAHFGNWHEDVHGLDWPAYLARRPGALRETIRRRLRRAERRRDANFTVITDGDGLQSGIEAFEQVYARSWKEPEPYPSFNAALMHEVAAAGLLRLGIWRIGGLPVAAQLWIVEHGTATVLKLAHDEVFKADSPGTVVTALMLRHLLQEEHVDAIDFGRGDDAYKQDWTGQRRQRIGLVFANPRRAAGLAFIARHAIGRLRRRLRDKG